MGKPPYFFSDSDETENTESSLENLKKKKKPSILKYTTGNVKKKKCKIHSKSEAEDSDFRSRSGSRNGQMKKLRGILKHKDREREKEASSDEESDAEPPKPIHRYLVGRVPRPAGAKPGRGGGVAIVVRKNIKNANSLQVPQSSTSHTKPKWYSGVSRKRSY